MEQENAEDRAEEVEWMDEDAREVRRVGEDGGRGQVVEVEWMDSDFGEVNSVGVDGGRGNGR